MRKKSFIKLIGIPLSHLAIVTHAFANPNIGQVVAGGAEFQQVGSELQIITNSDRTIIDFQDFSIAAGDITNFIQPNANSATLNRVVGNLPTEIIGNLVSNGQVAIINPNGVLICLLYTSDAADE